MYTLNYRGGWVVHLHNEVLEIVGSNLRIDIGPPLSLGNPAVSPLRFGGTDMKIIATIFISERPECYDAENDLLLELERFGNEISFMNALLSTVALGG